MTLSPTVTFGDLLMLFTLVVGGLAAFGKLKVLETKVRIMWGWFSRHVIDGEPHDA